MPNLNQELDIVDNSAVNSIGNFALGDIGFERPILGVDLLQLQSKLGLQVHGMISILGLNTPSWYKHVTDPLVKRRKKLERELGRLLEKTRNLGLEKCQGKTARQALEKEQQQHRPVIASIEAELQADSVADCRSNGSRFYGITDEALALLIRFLDSNEDYVARATLIPRTFHDLRNRLPGVSPSELSQLLGRDATASYRWMRDGAEPHPTVARLIDCLVYWFDSTSDKGTVLSKLDLWRNLVRREYELRAAWTIRNAPDAANSDPSVQARVASSGSEW